jgi:cell division protein FtsZ
MTLHIGSKTLQKTPIISRKPVIKILGLGGGGSNAVNRLVELGMEDVEYIAANTDLQALRQSLAPRKIQLGPKLTRGLGAGGNPKMGEGAAEESYRELGDALSGADMVFLTAGMGGGTGTGSIAVAARVAREVGAVTVAVVTTPFSFEVGRRQNNAREGLARLQPHADTLITVPNDRLLQIAPRNLTLDLAFQLADDVLRQGIQGIAELVTQPGLINVDFAHIRQIMQQGGGALMSIGMGEGENKALKALEQALHHPLLDSISIDSATGIIANFTGGQSLGFLEVMEALNYLQTLTSHSAEIIPGVITNPRMDDRAQVILVITGLGATAVEAPKPVAQAAPVQQNASAWQTASVQQVMPSMVPATGMNTAQRPAPMQSARTTGSLPGSRMPFDSNMPASSAAARPAPQAPSIEVSSVTPADIDLPAFMRRRNSR